MSIEQHLRPSLCGIDLAYQAPRAGCTCRPCRLRRPSLAQVVACDCCAGTGEVLAQAVPTTPDALTVEVTCPLCGGLGIRLIAKETTA